MTMRTADSPTASDLWPLLWDCHLCLPLDPASSMDILSRHAAHGPAVISINVGMDMNNIPQILRVIAAFTAQVAAKSDRFALVSTIADIEAAHAAGQIALYFDLEGSVMLQDMPEMIPVFYKLGVRQIHFAYNRSNSVAGGCHDEDTGLTALGEKMVAAVNATGMLMDCSHMGKKSSLDVMNVSSKPVIFSHTNPRALRDHARCIDDELIKACAAQGGVIGLSGYAPFVGTDDVPTPEDMARQVDYIVELVGIDHVGFGLDCMYAQDGCSDFPDGVDRAYWWPARAQPGQKRYPSVFFPPEHFPAVAEALDKRGYNTAERAKVFGLNFLHVARKSWQPAPGALD